MLMSRKRQVLYALIGLCVLITLMVTTYKFLCISDPQTKDSPNQRDHPVVRSHKEQAAGSYIRVHREPKKENVDSIETLGGSVLPREKMTNEEKRKKQRLDVDRFCRRYKLEKQKFIPPQREIHLLYNRLLVNERSKTLFCAVPETGSTSLIAVNLVALGLLPEATVKSDRGSITGSILQLLVQNITFRTVPSEKRLLTLKKSFKYMMYRDPLERLASAYRSKISNHSLIGLNLTTSDYNGMRHRIYEYTHPLEYKLWVKDGQKEPVKIPFSDFVTYWLTGNDKQVKNNPYFASTFLMCQPCRVRYTYYGHFENFEEDANVLFRQIGASKHQLREGSKKKDESILSLYDELSYKQKVEVLKKLYTDLDFYYHVFPQSADSHKHILGIDIELSSLKL